MMRAEGFPKESGILRNALGVMEVELAVARVNDPNVRS